jgi:hypothetical protein
MQNGIAEFLNYNQHKLATAPAEGENPPVGTVFKWYTLDGDNKLVINYRLSDGTNKTFIEEAGSGVTAAFFAWEWTSPDDTFDNTSGYTSWKTLKLNTLGAANNIANASLNNYQVTLPAGTYVALFSCQGQQDGLSETMVRLYDITNVKTRGIAPPAIGSNNGAEICTGMGLFTLPAESVLALQFWHTGRYDFMYTVPSTTEVKYPVEITFLKIG